MPIQDAKRFMRKSIKSIDFRKRVQKCVSVSDFEALQSEYNMFFTHAEMEDACTILHTECASPEEANDFFSIVQWYNLVQSSLEK